jgi:hypothetical protein
MSRKQEIYKEMLRWGIPYLRDQQARGAWQRMKDQASLFEAQLLHSLPDSILVADFNENDIWFLNHHAKDYLVGCNAEISRNYELNRKLIRELFALVPESQRGQMEWSGPPAV